MFESRISTRAWSWGALLGILLVTAGARAASIGENIDRVLQQREAVLIEVRRDLHRHPELAGEEVRTAAVVAKHLRGLGLEVQTEVGGHGVIGLLRGALPGPVVAYRADMDAMASDAPDPVSFGSEAPGVRHICGHDMHVTVGLGIAEVLAASREQLAGTVKFVFQPAEESAEGARAMIVDGAMLDPAPRAIFAVHCAPLPVGQFGSRPGMMLPGLDIITIELTGEGDLSTAAEACAQVVAGVSSTTGLAPDHDGTEDALDAAMEPGSFISAGVFASEASADGWSIRAMARASSEAMHARAKRGVEEGLTALELGDVRYQLDSDPSAATTPSWSWRKRRRSSARTSLSSRKSRPEPSSSWVCPTKRRASSECLITRCSWPTRRRSPWASGT
jgi:amidohydrolase